MNIAKKVLMFFGFVMLAAILVSMLAPKQTHALVATLVQVANTPASPVPNKDIDSPAHATVVALTCISPFDAPVQCVLGEGYPYTPYTVPAGQRLVVEQVSANCQVSPVGSLPYVNFGLTEGGTPVLAALALTNTVPQAPGLFSNYEVVNQSVRYYADSGTELGFNAPPNGSASAACAFTASGYLVSYP